MRNFKELIAYSELEESLKDYELAHIVPTYSFHTKKRKLHDKEKERVIYFVFYSESRYWSYKRIDIFENQRYFQIAEILDTTRITSHVMGESIEIDDTELKFLFRSIDGLKNEEYKTILKNEIIRLINNASGVEQKGEKK